MKITAKQRKSIVNKLHPSNFRVSPKMSAILCHLVGERDWTSPNMGSLSITSDGFVLGQLGNALLGTAIDLEDNLRGCMRAAELTPKECDAFWQMAVGSIQDWRRNRTFGDPYGKGDRA